MASTHLQFRPEQGLAEQIRERTSIPQGDVTTSVVEALMSNTLRRDVTRYYDVLIRSLPKFSMGEAKFLADILNGTIHAPYSVSLLWAEASDGVQQGFAEKHEIDGPALVERLRTLTPFECMAVADAIERVWNADTYHVENMQERLRKVGLVKEEAK